MGNRKLLFTTKVSKDSLEVFGSSNDKADVIVENNRSYLRYTEKGFQPSSNPNVFVARCFERPSDEQLLKSYFPRVLISPRIHTFTGDKAPENMLEEKQVSLYFELDSEKPCFVVETTEEIEEFEIVTVTRNSKRRYYVIVSGEDVMDVDW
jgi:hypothetical protein